MNIILNSDLLEIPNSKITYVLKRRNKRGQTEYCIHKSFWKGWGHPIFKRVGLRVLFSNNADELCIFTLCNVS